MKHFPVSAAALLTLAALSLLGCHKDGTGEPAQAGTLTLRLHHGVTTPGTTTFTPLVLDAATYQNANGDAFTVSTFKYYLSNLQLLRADNSTYAVPDSYYLVDQAAAESQELLLRDVPVGDYTGLRFVVGVDSTRTKAGNFTGVLNADKGMLWTMNGPEFINLKLEGRSPQSPTTGLVFHLAGYKHGATNTIRTVSPAFPGAALQVRADRAPALHLRVDIARLFTGPNPPSPLPPPFLNPVSFATVFNQMSGRPVAKLADNVAAGMFSVTYIDAN